MKKSLIREMAVYAIVATIYVVVTWTLSFMSFGAIQVRIAEALVLLCFFNKKYFTPLVIGCFLANLFSPYGMIDIALGTLATALGLIGVMKSKNMIVASIFPVISNALIIGLELTFINGVFEMPVFMFNFVAVAIGEIISVSVLGVILFMILMKNHAFMELIDADPQKYLFETEK